MSMRVAMLLCMLGLGCTDKENELAADGGRELAATALPSHRELIRHVSSSKHWIVRRMTRAAGSKLAMSDAGRPSGITPVQQVRPDGGATPTKLEAPPEPLVDAGPQPDDEDAGSGDTPCDSPTCLCARMCERGLALECPEEDTLEVCVEQCSVVVPDCYDQLLRVVRCSVALPDAAYSCDPDIEVFVVDGCAAETLALQTCSRF